MYISIGIPIYNAENYLENAIKSVLIQSYQNWELILLDDGSTDNSLSIAKKYAALDNRIRIISDGKNKRLPARLNEIIRESKYDLIARMDADDIMHPNRLERQVEILKDHSIDLVSTSYYTINSEDKVISNRIISKSNLVLDDFINGNYYILHPSILARKSWYLENGYDPNFDRAEDYELWVRAIINGKLKIHILSESLMFYREEGSISKNKQLLSYQATAKMLDKYRDAFGLKRYLKAKIRNNTKILIFKLIYSKAFESYLINKRNKLNLSGGNLVEAQDILGKIQAI